MTIAALIVDVLTILSNYGQSTVAQIQQNLATTGTNATGKTSRSLRFEVQEKGDKQILLVIGGRKYFMTVETGRKATPQFTKPSTEFVASIKEWMSAKGIEGPAYGIAMAIHQRGTKLFQTGGRRDIVSNVVNQSLVDQISKDVLAQFATAYLQSTVTIFNSGSNPTK